MYTEIYVQSLRLAVIFPVLSNSILLSEMEWTDDFFTFWNEGPLRMTFHIFSLKQINIENMQFKSYVENYPGGVRLQIYILIFKKIYKF